MKILLTKISAYFKKQSTILYLFEFQLFDSFQRLQVQNMKGLKLYGHDLCKLRTKQLVRSFNSYG